MPNVTAFLSQVLMAQILSAPSPGKVGPPWALNFSLLETVEILWLYFLLCLGHWEVQRGPWPGDWLEHTRYSVGCLFLWAPLTALPTFSFYTNFCINF